MAGILNSKERIIDFIMTEEGKRQASSGQMKIEFASFTDMHTFYEVSSSIGSGDPRALPGVAEDASSRLYFEASNRFQDVIVPELEAGNSLRPFRTSDFTFSGKILASGTFNVGFAEKLNILTGSKITNESMRSLNGITNNFVQQKTCFLTLLDSSFRSLQVVSLLTNQLSTEELTQAQLHWMTRPACLLIEDSLTCLTFDTCRLSTPSSPERQKQHL